MKTEHRKELKTNALADALGKFIKGQWKAPSSTTLIVGLFALLLVALVVAWFVYASVASAGRAALWAQLDATAAKQPSDQELKELAAKNPAASQAQLLVLYQQTTLTKELEELAAKNPGTTPARIADVQRARALLRQGLEQFCDVNDKKRDEAPKLLDEAATIYEKVAREGLDNPLLQHEALLGAAKAKESQGKVDEALEGYKKLAGMGETVFAKQAEEQRKYLEEHKAEVKEFYAKLDEQRKKAFRLNPLPTP